MSKEAFIGEAKKFMRDILISDILNGKISIDNPSKLLNISLFRNKSIKKSEKLLKSGAILTGSKALSLYKYNGVPLLSRKSNDWDFIMDKPSFYKYCRENKYRNIKFGDKILSLNVTTGIPLGRSTYSDYVYRLFRSSIDIIATEDDVDFKIVNGYKIASLKYILNQKLELIEKCYNTNISSKHYNDILSIMTDHNFGSILKIMIDE